MYRAGKWTFGSMREKKQDRCREKIIGIGKIGVWAGLLPALLILLILCGGRIRAEAAENQFLIDAELLPGGDGITYDVRLSVQNNGGDWAGTARLTIGNGNRVPCAYDTDLSLPGGSRKQFTVRIPVGSIEDERLAAAHVLLLDEQGKEAAEKVFQRFLENEADTLKMGILSDDYASLTYLDMGGKSLYFYGYEYPVRLMELDRDRLADSLDSLAMLVIDRYHTEILTEEDLSALRYWVMDGGVLIIGTGAYAEDTLGGFDDHFVGVEANVSADSQGTTGAGSGTVPATGADRPASEDGWMNLVDREQLILADLSLNKQDYIRVAGGWVAPWNNGAVAVMPYSFSELGGLGPDAFSGLDRAEIIRGVLDEIAVYSSKRYDTAGNRYNLESIRNRLFSVLGNSGSSFNMGVLKLIVVGYVIFVGPVLYLILRAVKKRELYWAAAPAAAVLGLALVYAAGRGFEVRDTRVYSVTAEELGGRGRFETFMLCYDAGYGEWQMRLGSDYDYIGPLYHSYYSGYDSDNGLNYYGHIERDGNGLSFGIKPRGSFENSYFQAGGSGRGSAQGSVELEEIKELDPAAAYSGLSGTVTNGTDQNFQYFALIRSGTMYVYGELPAGESRRLEEMGFLYDGIPVYDGYGDYVFWLRRFDNESVTNGLAALGIGICGLATQAEGTGTFFIGVVRDYEKAVDDVCSEVSYGCFYFAQ